MNFRKINLVIFSAFTLLFSSVGLGSQDALAGCTEATAIIFNQSFYFVSQTPQITVDDASRNINSVVIETLNIDVWSDSDAGGLDLVAIETGVDTGIFSVIFSLSDTAPSPVALFVAVGDTITTEGPCGIISTTAGIIATSLPPAPSTPDLDAGSDSGSSSSDDLTNDDTPTFTGTAEAGSTVEIFDGATEVGSGLATGGLYSISTSTLSDGGHSITAKATNLAGTSPASASLSVTIDTVEPAAPTGLDLEEASDSGTSASDDITNVDTPDISGDAESSSTVTLTSDQDGEIGTGTANSPFTITTNALSENTHLITATATDAAGNESPSSTDLSVTIDTTQPEMDSAITTSTTTIDVTFSEDLDGTSVSTSDFTIGGVLVDIATESAPGIVTLTAADEFGTGDTPDVELLSGSVDDVAGNTLDSAGPIIPADGVSPVVESLVPSLSTIAEADAGGVFTLSITYSEDMDTLLDPLIDYTPDVESSPITLDNFVGSWDVDERTFIATYDILDNDVEALVDVDVFGAQDPSANIQDLFSQSDAFEVDTVKPTGTVTINDGDLSTTSRSVTLDITCTDAGSGCSQRLVAEDGVIDLEGYVSPAVVSDVLATLPPVRGDKTVYALFKDAAGNISDPAAEDSIALDAKINDLTAEPQGSDATGEWEHVLFTLSGTVENPRFDDNMQIDFDYKVTNSDPTFDLPAGYIFPIPLGIQVVALTEIDEDTYSFTASSEYPRPSKDTKDSGDHTHTGVGTLLDSLNAVVNENDLDDGPVTLVSSNNVVVKERETTVNLNLIPDTFINNRIGVTGGLSTSLSPDTTGQSGLVDDVDKTGIPQKPITFVITNGGDTSLADVITHDGITFGDDDTIDVDSLGVMRLKPAIDSSGTGSTILTPHLPGFITLTVEDSGDRTFLLKVTDGSPIDPDTLLPNVFEEEFTVASSGPGQITLTDVDGIAKIEVFEIYAEAGVPVPLSGETLGLTHIETRGFQLEIINSFSFEPDLSFTTRTYDRGFYFSEGEASSTPLAAINIEAKFVDNNDPDFLPSFNPAASLPLNQKIFNVAPSGLSGFSNTGSFTINADSDKGVYSVLCQQGDPLYMDVDSSGTRNVGDLRIANARSIGFNDGTIIQAGNSDATVVAWSSPSAIPGPVRYVEEAGGAGFTANEETLYEDKNNNGLRDAGDRRLANAGRQLGTIGQGFADGSIIANLDPDNDGVSYTNFAQAVKWVNNGPPAGFTPDDDTDRDAMCDSWELNGIPYEFSALIFSLPMNLPCPSCTGNDLTLPSGRVANLLDEEAVYSGTEVSNDLTPKIGIRDVYMEIDGMSEHPFDVRAMNDVIKLHADASDSPYASGPIALHVWLDQGRQLTKFVDAGSLNGVFDSGEALYISTDLTVGVGDKRLVNTIQDYSAVASGASDIVNTLTATTVPNNGMPHKDSSDFTLWEDGDEFFDEDYNNVKGENQGRKSDISPFITKDETIKVKVVDQSLGKYEIIIQGGMKVTTPFDPRSGGVVDRTKGIIEIRPRIETDGFAKFTTSAPTVTGTTGPFLSIQSVDILSNTGLSNFKKVLQLKIVYLATKQLTDVPVGDITIPFTMNNLGQGPLGCTSLDPPRAPGFFCTDGDVVASSPQISSRLKDSYQQAWRYIENIHGFGGPSGEAELLGNDMALGLGGFGPSFNGHSGGTRHQQAGTLAHELIHWFNGLHGGPAYLITDPSKTILSDTSRNCKPYPGVDKYTNQLPDQYLTAILSNPSDVQSDLLSTSEWKLTYSDGSHGINLLEVTFDQQHVVDLAGLGGLVQGLTESLPGGLNENTNTGMPGTPYTMVWASTETTSHDFGTPSDHTFHKHDSKASGPVGNNFNQVYQAGDIDWNDDLSISGSGVAADINNFGIAGCGLGVDPTMYDYDSFFHFDYNYRSAPSGQFDGIALFVSNTVLASDKYLTSMTNPASVFTGYDPQDQQTGQKIVKAGSNYPLVVEITTDGNPQFLEETGKAHVFVSKDRFATATSPTPVQGDPRIEWVQISDNSPLNNSPGKLLMRWNPNKGLLGAFQMDWKTPSDGRAFGLPVNINMEGDWYIRTVFFDPAGDPAFQNIGLLGVEGVADSKFLVDVQTPHLDNDGTGTDPNGIPDEQQRASGKIVITKSGPGETPPPIPPGQDTVMDDLIALHNQLENDGHINKATSKNLRNYLNQAKNAFAESPSNTTLGCAKLDEYESKVETTSLGKLDPFARGALGPAVDNAQSLKLCSDSLAPTTLSLGGSNSSPSQPK